MPTFSRFTAKLVAGARDYWNGSALRLFPLGASLRGYSGGAFFDDSRAGINVALLAFPQGMAYAIIAGLPIVYGITCSAVAALVAPMLVGSRHTAVGPTNATAFMVFSSLSAVPLMADRAMMPVLVFMVGILLLLGAFFRMADMVQYISRSVVVGYLTGAAILIIGNQLRHVLGISFTLEGGASGFFSIVKATVLNVPSMHLPTLGVSVLTFALYFGLKRSFPRWPVFAIVLVVVSGLSGLGRRWGIEVATFTAFEPSDLLPSYPDFATTGLWAIVSQLSGVAFAVAFLASLENSVMGKSLAAKTGDRPNLNQDMVGLGAANVACGLLSGMPCSGSLTRSALNYESGARSQVSMIICGLLCAIGAFTLGPAIQYVPKACLAALVIGIALSLISRKNVRICLAATKSDAVTLVVTVISTLIMPLHVAIFVGVGVSVALYLRKSSRPELVEYEFNEHGNLRERDGKAQERQNPSISIVHVEGALFFGAAELFRTQIQRTVNDPSLKVIILRMKNAHHLDATSVMALEELILTLRENDRYLIVSGAMKEVYRVLKNSGVVGVLGRENLFMGSPSNPNVSTRNALKRAQEILGGEKAEVKIYYDPSRPRE